MVKNKVENPNGNNGTQMSISGMVDDKGNKDFEQLRYLVESYYDIQDVRVRTGNRTFQLTQKGIDTEQERETTKGKVSETYAESLKRIESTIQKQIEVILKSVPLWTEYLKDIRGIGPVLAGGVIGYIYKPVGIDIKKCSVFPEHKTCHCGKSIERFPNISKLHAYAGLHVVNGKAPKREKNVKSNWNSKFRTLSWKIGQSFMKQPEEKSFYRDLYSKEKVKLGFVKTADGWDMPKEIREQWIAKGVGQTNEIKKKLEQGQEISNEKDAVKGHLDARVRRKVVKLFLSHVWLKWRESEGLSVTDPYPMTKMGGEHTGLITADEVHKWELERK